jgi:hypothetical protein
VTLLISCSIEMLFGSASSWLSACVFFCSVLTGCGGAEIPRASAPSVPDAEARCRAAARTDSPLITEWSAAEKANLQARLRSGALAVEYTGCSMRPLPACTLRGSYRWQRTTLSSDGIEIRSQDDLFAKLPLGAVALEGELARSGRISVRTMVSGQYLLEGSSVADVPDYGECAQATHLLSALSIGSFKLHSGGTLDGGISAGVGDYGGGARTSSAETLLREAGDFDTCKLATDETTDIGCSSPIQAFLVPLPRFARERGSGTLRVTFAAGSSDRPWELRSNQQFVCRTPCQRWVNPSESYQLRTEGGPELETLEVPDLRAYRDERELEVRAHPRNKGRFFGGIITAGVGGGLAFMGGFLALAGGLGERDGLVIAGAITGGIGLVAIGPGVYLLATSGSHAEVRSERGPLAETRGIGLRATF